MERQVPYQTVLPAEQAKKADLVMKFLHQEGVIPKATRYEFTQYCIYHVIWEVNDLLNKAIETRERELKKSTAKKGQKRPFNKGVSR